MKFDSKQTIDDSPVDRRARVLKKIQYLFTKLSIEFEFGKSLRFTDNNIAIESVMGVLLNAVYGWNLKLQNRGATDQPGYDLYDEKRLIAVDATTDRDRDKVTKSLKQVELINRDNKIQEFYICFPKVRGDREKANRFKKQFNYSKIFDPNRHILDLNSLIEEIRDREVDQLQEFLDLVGTQLHDPDLVSTATKVRNRIQDYLIQLRGEFETIPTVCGNDGLLWASNAIEPEFRNQSLAESSDEVRMLSICDLAELESNIVVLAPAGGGKSVAFRLLVRQLVDSYLRQESDNEPPILPLYFPYPPFHNDIESAVASRLAIIFGSAVDFSLFEFSEYASVTLILDSLDESVVPQRFKDAIISFAKRFPLIRIVLGGRACSQGIASAFQRIQLRPLSNFRIQRYLCQLFGPDRSSMIFNRIELHGNLENFRNPLMCSFLRGAGDSAESSFSERIFWFYKNSIEGFLSEMQTKDNRLSLASVNIDELMIFLGAVGLAMVSGGVQLLDGQATQKIWRGSLRNQPHRTSPEDLPKYLELAVLGGVMNSSVTGVSFTHDTIRQFFAAFHLSKLPTRRWPMTIFWADRWHQVAVFLVSGMDEPRALPIIGRLAKSVKGCVKLGCFHFPQGTYRLFLTLKLLAQFGDSARCLSEAVVRDLHDIGLGQLFLTRKEADIASRDGMSRYDSLHEEFFSLIGALGHEIAADLLNSYREYYRATALKGYFRLENSYRTQILMGILLEPVRQNDDCGFRHEVAEYLVRNADHQILKLIKKIIQERPIVEKVSMLDAINWGFIRLRGLDDREERDAIIYLFRGALLDTLMDLILNDPDELVREHSLWVIRKFGDEFLPLEVARACCMAISAEIPNYNAIWPLIYACDKDSPTIIADMISRCSLSAVDCAEMGLSVLRRRDKELFHSALQNFLSFYSKDYVDSLRQASGEANEDLSQPEKQVFWNLLFGTVFPSGSIRFMAWWTILFQDKCDFSIEVQEYAIKRFAADDYCEVRRIILDRILELDRSDSAELARLGLSDDSGGVIRVALNYYRDHPEIEMDLATRILIEEAASRGSDGWNVHPPTASTSPEPKL